MPSRLLFEFPATGGIVKKQDPREGALWQSNYCGSVGGAIRRPCQLIIELTTLNLNVEVLKFLDPVSYTGLASPWEPSPRRKRLVQVGATAYGNKGAVATRPGRKILRSESDVSCRSILPPTSLERDRPRLNTQAENRTWKFAGSGAPRPGVWLLSSSGGALPHPRSSSTSISSLLLLLFV